MKTFFATIPLTALAILAGCGKSDGLKELAEARAAIEVKDYVRASKLLIESLEAAPDNVDALVSSAQVALALGNLEEAAKTIAKARRTNAEDLDIRFLAAQIAWHLKKYDEATSLYREIAEDTGLPAAERSRGRTGLGIVQMSAGEPHLARTSFLIALRQDRTNAAAWYHLGLVYRDSPFGYNEAALEQFNIYVRLDSEASPRVQKTQRTLIPALKEMIQRAAMERPGAAKRDSAACTTLLAAAETAMKKKQFKTARQKYEQALQADPLSYPAALGLAKALENVDASKLGQQKAFEAYAVACSLRPSAVNTLLTAGALAAKLSLNSQAVDIYSRAMAANPASLDAVDGLIRALRKVKGRGKIANAYQQYRDVLPVPRRK